MPLLKYQSICKTQPAFPDGFFGFAYWGSQKITLNLKLFHLLYFLPSSLCQICKTQPFKEYAKVIFNKNWCAVSVVFLKIALPLLPLFFAHLFPRYTRFFSLNLDNQDNSKVAHLDRPQDPRDLFNRPLRILRRNPQGLQTLHLQLHRRDHLKQPRRYLHR